MKINKLYKKIYTKLCHCSRDKLLKGRHVAFLMLQVGGMIFA